MIVSVTLIAVYWLLRLLWILAAVAIGAVAGLVFVLVILRLSPGSIPDLHAWMTHR